MPEGGLVCRKCRSGLSEEGEHWCKLCSCAQALSELARTRFAYRTHRSLAEETVFQVVRQVKAIVEVDQQTCSQVTSLSDRLDNANKKLQEVTVHIERSAHPKSLPARPRESAEVKAEPREGEGDRGEEADCGSEDIEEESQEEEIERETERQRGPSSS